MQYYINEPKHDVAKTVTVVTPSIGKSTLKDAIDSVFEQKLEDGVRLRHFIVWDGPVDKSEFDGFFHDNLFQMQLPWNVGKNFYGHRVYAASPHLINDDVVMFLDEDNMYDVNHVSTCLQALGNDFDFVFSLRSIVDRKGNFICNDKFESIGEPPLLLVDTSSYCFRRSWLVNTSHLWHYGWGADRRFFGMVHDHLYTNWTCTNQHTLKYRLDGNQGSPTEAFFRQGNLQHGFTEDGK